MRIAQVATMSAPVTRDGGGSVETLLWLFARELTRLGHDVTVFGVAGSDPEAKLVATLPGPYATQGAPDDWHLCEWINLCRALDASGQFDLVHTHAYLWGIPLEPLSRAPLVHTLHIAPDEDAARLWRSRPGAHVVALSRRQWSEWPEFRPAAVIPHGIDFDQFHFESEPRDYVLYLGRFVSSKGPLHAIEVARRAGVRLILAGPENAYFREKLRPLIDGRRVEYAGYVQGAARSQLLGGARALLCPLQYPEPFGLVMAEAMACGTPVAAVGVGAVPEIVESGVTGYYTDRADQLPDLLPACFALDRGAIRHRALARFTIERMVQDHLRLYQSILEEASRP